MSTAQPSALALALLLAATTGLPACSDQAATGTGTSGSGGTGAGGGTPAGLNSASPLLAT